MSLARSSFLASALVVAVGCSSADKGDAGVEDLSVDDLAPAHSRMLVEAACPASLSSTYASCYIDHTPTPTDFF